MDMDIDIDIVITKFTYELKKTSEQSIQMKRWLVHFCVIQVANFASISNCSTV